MIHFHSYIQSHPFIFHRRRLLSVLDLPDLRRNLECALEDESTALAKNDTQAAALAQEQVCD
jgi:hypothetical protein